MHDDIKVFDIDLYFDSLPEDIEKIDVSKKGLKYIPDKISKFKNLKILNCGFNKLSLLPPLPKDLQKLNCDFNKLSSLPDLPNNLEELYCDFNKLTSLPVLNKNLCILYCCNNQLTSLPPLPKDLQRLYCENNRLSSLPLLNTNLKTLIYRSNPIYEIINSNYIQLINKKVKILNVFRHLYYSLRFKKQFRDWLWVKVREPKIRQKYHPMYLLQNLCDEDADLDTVLDNWI